ncbi:MAG: sodium:proton antiporter, partial [Caulobacter sp.]|nr:sodium:proton antiporter [Caulobacter sp.]
LGGVALAFIPGAPRLAFEPDLVLALFVAPILLDAAYDSSLRDLKDNWRPVAALVLGAVTATTVAVAVVAKMMVPDMPWPAAVALGAIVAPPDAVAAIAVLRQIKPPYRILKVLEGESLLNDASALLIYRLAVSAAGVGFTLTHAAPTFGLVAVGSVVAGVALARLSRPFFGGIQDPSSSIVVQFVATFGVWILAERLHLSGVITIVCYGVTLARQRGNPMPSRLRLPSFAVWETATFVLNVLAFTLIGLQIGPILEPLSRAQRETYFVVAGVVLTMVILVRLVWVMGYGAMVRQKNRWFGVHVARRGMSPPTIKSGLLVAWCGMRGVVSLAAALALPEGFPERDLIILAAFVVVVGTLVLQGLTLGPLLRLLNLPPDDIVETELALARKMALKAAVASLEGETSAAAEALRREYCQSLERAKSGGAIRDSLDNALRRRMVEASRRSSADLRDRGEIGDDAYHRLEEELDWLEMSARG